MNTNRRLAIIFTCLLVCVLLAGCVAPAATPAPAKATAHPDQLAQPFAAELAAPDDGVDIGPTGGESQLGSGGIALGVRAPAPKSTRTPPTPKPPAEGEVLFSDDFSDPDAGGWATGSEDGLFDVFIEDGAMNIHVEEETYVIKTWRPSDTAADFVMDVDVQLAKGAKSAVLGLLARGGKAGYILFGIDNGGHTEVILYDGGWSTPGGGDKNSAIDTKAGAINHLRLVAEGPDYTLLVNGKEVLQLEEDTVAEGVYGLFLLSYDGPATATFDNFVLSTPGGEPDTPTPTPTPEPSQEVIFSDDFSDNAGGWNVSKGDGYRNRISGGQLTVQISKPQWMAWSSNAQTESDYILDVDGQWRDGEEDGQYGVILRLGQTKSKGNQFYCFGIVPVDGYYYFDLNVDGEWQVLANGWSDAILPEQGETNHLRIVADGDTFTLFVNGEELDEVTDDTLSEGFYGLFAGTGYGDTMQAAFDNFLLTTVK